MRNIFLTFVSLLVFSSFGKAQENTFTHENNMNENGLIHTVYFWLTDDVTEERKKEFEQALIDLSKVPSIDKFYWGPPAVTVDRDVIDKSYDYAINVFFKSVEAEEEYQIDPLHLKFVETQKEIFKTVKVYNNLY